MEKENRNLVPSYVGPLGRAEDSADRFVSGMVFCALLEKLSEQQRVVNAVLAGDAEPDKKDEALDIDAGLEKVWMSLTESIAIEC
jgi:hypothetical protein